MNLNEPNISMLDKFASRFVICCVIDKAEWCNKEIRKLQ